MSGSWGRNEGFRLLKWRNNRSNLDPVRCYTVLTKVHTKEKTATKSNTYCIFSQRSRGVPWFVLLSKLCLCKWEFISLMSNAFNLTINYVESSIREDEDVTFNIPWAWHLSVNCKRNSFFRIHPSQSTFYEDHCLIYSWDRWQKRVCLQHRSLLHSSRSFLFQIFWRPLPAYLLSPFLDCKPHWDSIGNYLHFSDVGLNVLTVSCTSDIRLVNGRSPFIDAHIDGRV